MSARNQTVPYSKQLVYSVYQFYSSQNGLSVPKLINTKRLLEVSFKNAVTQNKQSRVLRPAESLCKKKGKTMKIIKR